MMNYTPFPTFLSPSYFCSYTHSWSQFLASLRCVYARRHRMYKKLKLRRKKVCLGDNIYMCLKKESLFCNSFIYIHKMSSG